MPQHQKQQSWTERTGYGAQQTGGATGDDIQATLRRNGFQHAQTSLGSTGLLGHWVGLAGTMAPIIIGELIDDPGKRWKVTRLTAVATAIAYEGVHTVHEVLRRREQKAKLAACKEDRAGEAKDEPEGRGV
jgi:hypothetical protein